MERTRDFSSRRFRFIPNTANTGGAVAINLSQAPEVLFASENIGPIFRFNEETRPVDAYDGETKTTAGYGMVDIALSDRARFVGGARVENYDQQVNTFDPFGLFLGRGLRPDQEHRRLPRRQPHLLGQAGHQPADELQPHRQPPGVPRAGGLRVHRRGGQPRGSRQSRTRPAPLIQNVDARLEKISGGRDVLAISGFFKDFDSPIERVVIAGAQPIVTYQNAQSARNLGVELEAARQFGSNLFLNLNYTFVDSKITLAPAQRTVQTSLERPLAGQSKNLFNAMAEVSGKGLLRPRPLQLLRRPDLRRGFERSAGHRRAGPRLPRRGPREAVRQGRLPPDLREPHRHRTPVHAGLRGAACLQAGSRDRLLVELQRVLIHLPKTLQEMNENMKTPSLGASRRLLSVALALTLATSPVASVYADLGPPTTVPGIAKPVVVVTGQVRGAESWTSNFVYLLRGAVFVEDGGTLNIQAGTLVVGEAGSVGTLIVKRGGRLNAIGTREQPIVFTSDQPVGLRARGDWGGIIINGRAPLNIPGGEGVGEADTGIYGGNNPNDNSGSMRYVRVEFAGTEFSPDNELNGIAFQGVGRGGSLRVHPGPHEQGRRSRVVRRHCRREVRDRHQRGRRQPRLDFRMVGPYSVRPGLAAWRRRGRGHRGRQQRVQQRTAAPLQSDVLQRHALRRSRSQRRRGERRAARSFAAAPPARSGTS